MISNETSTWGPNAATAALERLLYRRQFLLAASPELAIGNSQCLRLGEKWFLSAHLDLEVTHLEVSEGSLTLLGMALDPEDPRAGNMEILDRLSKAATTQSGLVEAVDSLGGRWVLIWRRGDSLVVMHDACAQRQVYFTRDGYEGPWLCGSEPGLMAAILGLQMDPDAVDFIRSRKADDMEIYWMPGDTTLYQEIVALLPNHLLDVEERQCKRYWPRGPVLEKPIQEVLDRSERLLAGSMASAAQRHPLTLSMTAGWDSRLILALNRTRAHAVRTFTISYPGLGVKAMDVAIPARLLGNLGIDHQVIEYPKSDDPEFKEVYGRNNPSANSAYCRDSQALHQGLAEERVCVTGDAAEIIKCYYQDHSRLDEITAMDLAKLSRLGTHRFVLDAFARWLEEARCQPIDVLDLFCWEQMAGRWQAKVRAEYDIAQESFSPLNHRALLMDMMGVAPIFRKGPSFIFLRLLIERLWPETLSEPINPPEPRTLLRRIASSLKRRVWAAAGGLIANLHRCRRKAPAMFAAAKSVR